MSDADGCGGFGLGMTGSEGVMSAWVDAGGDDDLVLLGVVLHFPFCDPSHSASYATRDRRLPPPSTPGHTDEVVALAS